MVPDATSVTPNDTMVKAFYTLATLGAKEMVLDVIQPESTYSQSRLMQ